MNEANILIIEDKKENSLYLKQIVEAEGHKVWTTGNGEDGMKLVRETPFSVVITELHMPGKNGKEITKEILKIDPNISVVVITVYNFISSAIDVMEEGAYGYITKPFNPKEIKIVLSRAVERCSLRSSNKDREHYAELSVKDGLTGIYNRRFFKLYINNKISLMKRMVDKFSILMVDIDHFKEYNDTNGHLAGDELLRKVSKIFQLSIRQGDAVFRYGGEEFVIFLDHSNKEGAVLVAERIRSSVNLYIPTSVSIGVGTFPDDGEDLEKLTANVDAALYRAKEGGRNKVCLAEKSGSGEK